MVNQMVDSAKPKMEAAIEHFTEELKTVRTGRASTAMIENVTVSYYGSPTPLKALATLTIPEATQILVQPFDASASKDIAAAIRDANLGFNPTDDGRSVRVVVPALTSERREEMVKLVNKMGEEARISIRQIRGKIWEDIQRSQKEGLITEENREWGRDELDKITSEFNKKIETLVKEKETEIRTV